MDMEKAVLARAGHHVLAAKVRAVLEHEVTKGCLPDLAPGPVRLEPAYRDLYDLATPLHPQVREQWVPEAPLREAELVRLRLWLSPEQNYSWNRSELLVKGLSCLGYRAALELMGNSAGVRLQVLCHCDDMAVFCSAFSGQFEQCEATVVQEDILGRLPPDVWQQTAFCDFYPPPPYSHRFTSPDEIQRSPYATLISALVAIPAPCLGLYQVLFAPVDPAHDWHHNVCQLLDLEFALKLISGPPHVFRYAQQTPSGDLRGMAMDAESKAHSDKPLFGVALRLGVIGAGSESEPLLRTLAVPTSLVQHGGRPLKWVREVDYLRSFSAEDLRGMFVSGVTYRPGFLMNSCELATLVHMPPADVVEQHRETLQALETLPADPCLSEGTPIGVCAYAGSERLVCIPSDLRTRHIHVIGRPGMGKSSLLETMVLDDIRRGHGVAVIDPHGALVQRLLCLLPPECHDRVIYLDPGDPDWVPIWNPLCSGGSLDAGRVADDLVRAFKSFVYGWGDRLEHLLRQALFAALHLPQGSLLDVSNLLRKRSDESKRLRSLAMECLESPAARLFWQHDFDQYRLSDLAPAHHKLGKLLTSGSVSLMLSQPQSAFTLRGVMEEGKLLLVDLSNLGSEVREILGCFLLSLLHLTALGRPPNSAASRPFHIYCDEAHRFLTDSLEDLLAETRKFSVSLTLAHHYMKQFEVKKADALSSVGSTIIFKVDSGDAQFLKKALQGRVRPEDLTILTVGEAVARIDNHIVRLRTHPPLPLPPDHCREAIVARSHALYCRSAREMRKAVACRPAPSRVPQTPSNPFAEGRGSRRPPTAKSRVSREDVASEAVDPEAFHYDEF